jgi:hypothetical protein
MHARIKSRYRPSQFTRALYQNNAEWQVISETHAPIILSGAQRSKDRVNASRALSRDSSTPLGISEIRSAMVDIASLLCPRCKVPLKNVRTSSGVFCGCHLCGGRAVTIDLLRKRFVPESIIHFDTLEQTAGMSSVSSAAHPGGAAVGFLAWLVWRKKNDESRMIE